MDKITKEVFIKEYKKKENTIKFLAEKWSVDRMTIYRWARKFNLPLKQKTPLIK